MGWNIIYLPWGISSLLTLRVTFHCTVIAAIVHFIAVILHFDQILTFDHKNSDFWNFQRNYSLISKSTSGKSWTFSFDFVKIWRKNLLVKKAFFFISKSTSVKILKVLSTIFLRLCQIQKKRSSCGKILKFCQNRIVVKIWKK